MRMRSGFWFALLVATSARVTVAEEFSRYQVIIDRSPFGPVTAAGAAGVTPNFAQRYQFVGLVNSSGGQGPVQAIIHDREANRTYFRAQGEELDEQSGVKMARIDLDPPKVILQSGLQTAQLTFQDRPNAPIVTAPGVPRPAAVPGPQPVTSRRIPFRRSN